MVFIGFTVIGRFEIYRPNVNASITYLPNQPIDMDTSFYEKHYVDRHSKYYVNEIMQKFKILESLSEKVGFKIFYWDWSTTMIKYEPNLNPKNWIVYEMFNKWMSISEIFNHLEKSNLDITNETNGEIIDGHWGKHNNDFLGKVFSNYLLENFNKTAG